MDYTNGKYEKFNSIGFLISRFIRLMPQLTIFMLMTTLIPLFGSGPIWNKHIGAQVNICYDNWWQNILCLQNFIDANNMVKTYLIELYT